MASVRITNEMRNTIVTVLLARKYGEEEKARAVESARLFDGYIDALLGKFKGAIESLPEGWTNRLLSVSIRYDEVSSKSFELHGAQSRRVPHGVYGWNQNISRLTITSVEDEFEDDDENVIKNTAPKKITKKLADDLFKFGKRYFELESEREKLERQIRGTLSNITTLKRLYEVWPEVRPLLKWSEEQPPNAGALVPNLANLNAVLDLPPKEEELADV